MAMTDEQAELVERLLRFYANATNHTYEWAIEEYLGKHPDDDGVVINFLYMAVSRELAELKEKK